MEFPWRRFRITDIDPRSNSTIEIIVTTDNWLEHIVEFRMDIVKLLALIYVELLVEYDTSRVWLRLAKGCSLGSRWK